MQQVLLGYMTTRLAAKTKRASGKRHITEATPQAHHPLLALRYLIFLLTSISVQKQYRLSHKDTLR
jgi:hypothetical protein